MIGYYLQPIGLNYFSDKTTRAVICQMVYHMRTTRKSIAPGGSTAKSELVT